MDKLDQENDSGTAGHIYAEIKDSRGVLIEELDGNSWEMAFIMALGQGGKGYADKTLLKDAFYKPKASHREHPRAKLTSLENICFSGQVGIYTKGPGKSFNVYFDPVPELEEKAEGARRMDCKFITAVSHDHKYHAMHMFNLSWPY
uniref:Uncharacterized protein n=1 Tax=viral metagenome TaxID=1070528 RepID=A0A2V0RAX0_9ZZZZ